MGPADLGTGIGEVELGAAFSLSTRALSASPRALLLLSFLIVAACLKPLDEVHIVVVVVVGCWLRPRNSGPKPPNKSKHPEPLSRGALLGLRGRGRRKMEARPPAARAGRATQMRPVLTWLVQPVIPPGGLPFGGAHRGINTCTSQLRQGLPTGAHPPGPQPISPCRQSKSWWGSAARMLSFAPAMTKCLR